MHVCVSVFFCFGIVGFVFFFMRNHIYSLSAKVLYREAGGVWLLKGKKRKKERVAATRTSSCALLISMVWWLVVDIECDS